VDNIVVVEVVDGIKHLSNSLSSVFLRKLSLVADTVEQLAAGRQLGYDVVFVLPCSAPAERVILELHPPSTQTSHET
jgi:hypothetical protein